MTLHTTFILDTSVSMAHIFEPLADDVLTPLLHELQRRARPDCAFRFGLYTFPEGGWRMTDCGAEELAALGTLTLSGGAPDGREPLLSPLNEVLGALPQPNADTLHALCIVSDTPAFSDMTQSMLSFFVPDSLLQITLLHHPECSGRLIPLLQAGLIANVSQNAYPLCDALREQIPEIARSLTDAVLTNSNLQGCGSR